MTAPQQVQKRGIVKQVLSGDTVIIRGRPIGKAPPEIQVFLSNINAPKLARRLTTPSNNTEESKDEPYAWEAREFLRKKLIGEMVTFIPDKNSTANASTSSSLPSREFGVILKGDENVTELLVAEGLVSVRKGDLSSPDLARLNELEEKAKSDGKGKWSTTSTPNDHIRNIKWNIDNPQNFIDKCAKKPIKAVIEHVRDGSTIRAFLLPDFYHITLMISGIKAPGFKLGSDNKPDKNDVTPYAEEAKFFVESRLLQRDVEIILESHNKTNFMGTIVHPKGNIAEALLSEGFARCVDWSMASMKSGADRLRAAERAAKEKKIRIWKDYKPIETHSQQKEFTGTVVEVVNGDALIVKLADGTLKKVFLASFRPPRENRSPQGPEEEKSNTVIQNRPKSFRPLYDIPWMFEAREFLRKKLIGKRVNILVDYVQAAKDNFPEKICCTITIGGVNVAEAMLSKGLGTVIHYRQDDDQRSSHYTELLAAENKAIKSGCGVHAKKDIPTHRISDVVGDLNKAKKFLSSLQRAIKTEAVCEFVASGSRLRLYVPKETCLITFLLAGINCPRGSRPQPGGGMAEGQEYGEEALVFTKDRCMQREVEIQVESMDKAGNFIGWLWVDNTNLSVALVEEGLATVHFSAERSEHYRTLKSAEDRAKARKLNLWKNHVEEVDEEIKNEDDRIVERKPDYQKVFVIEVTRELHFYAQLEEQGPKLESLMAKIRQDFSVNSPLPGAYTPKRGDICAALYSEDKQWYRARVEKISGGEAQVFYIDYGNRENIATTFLASLPPAFTAEKGYAQEYGLACIQLPKDPDYSEDSFQNFKEEVEGRSFNLNIEYRVNNFPYASLVDSKTEEDIAKSLISEGFLLVEKRKENRLQKMLKEYLEAQEAAKKMHKNVWRYGDITEDEAKEFGLGR